MLDSLVRALDDRILSDSTLDQSQFERLIARQRELGLVYGDRPTCPFLRPHIISRTQYDTVARAASIIASAVERLANYALLDDDLLAAIGLTERETQMARVDPGYSRLCVSSRLDAYLTGSDFKFFEYNAETPAGVGDQMQLEKVLFGLAHMRVWWRRCSILSANGAAQQSARALRSSIGKASRLRVSFGFSRITLWHRASRPSSQIPERWISTVIVCAPAIFPSTLFTSASSFTSSWSGATKIIRWRARTNGAASVSSIRFAQRWRTRRISLRSSAIRHTNISSRRKKLRFFIVTFRGRAAWLGAKRRLRGRRMI